MGVQFLASKRLRAAGSMLSVQRSLALLQRIQQHHVQIQQKPVTCTSRITAEQRDLFKALALTPPADSTTL